MKFVYVSCNISKLEQILELNHELGIRSFQIAENVTGSFESGDPRMDTSVWPGMNSAMFMQLSPEKCREFLGRIRQMNKEIINENERVLAASWECEDFVYADDAAGDAE